MVNVLPSVLNNVKSGISITSRKIVYCKNVQCDKKCDLLIQYNIKMVQNDKIVLNDTSNVA